MFRRRQRESEREEEGRDCSALCDAAGRRLILKFLQDAHGSTHKMTPTPPPLVFFFSPKKLKNKECDAAVTPAHACKYAKGGLHHLTGECYFKRNPKSCMQSDRRVSLS